MWETYIGNSGVDVNVVGGNIWADTHTNSSLHGLTKSNLVAQHIADILTNIVTYIVVYPNVARDVYGSVFNLSGDKCWRCGHAIRPLAQSTEAQDRHIQDK